MSPRRLSSLALALAAVAVVVVGLVELAGSSSSAPASSLTLAQMRARLTGSPAPLAVLHAQASELLAGGLGAVRARIAALRGHPLVINKWASWCGPCRAEAGAFQGAAVALGRQVAFIGIDSADTSRSEALDFLRSHPLPYPSYYDSSGQAGAAIADSAFTPVTVFFDPRGSEYIRQGPYPSQAKLEADIRRYALDA